MNKLSVTIVTGNEESNIRDSLESIKWADEIVVLDSYSKDRTIEICKEYTGNILKHQWPGYIEQKNLVLKHTSNNWVLSIDADERVSGELASEIRRILKDTGEYAGFYIPRKNFYLGKWISFSGWYPDLKIRLFDKSRGSWEGLNPHDSIKLDGKTGYLKGIIEHFSYSNISAHEERVNRFSSIGAEELYKSGKACKTSDIVARPLLAFMKKLIFKQSYRDGVRGVMISVFTYYQVFLKYAKLWEKSRGL